MAIAMTCYARLISDIRQQNGANTHMLLIQRYIPGTAVVFMSSHTGLHKAVDKGDRLLCRSMQAFTLASLSMSKAQLHM